MLKDKYPFVGYTQEEVKRMEENYFVLQLGGDFVLEDDYYLFTKGEVSKLHKNMLKKLNDIIKDGNEKDRNYALDLICGLAIKPMRLH